MTGGGIEFVVLTGFLGSGKTTLLRDFLPSPEAADTAVIVNEAGEIDLDGALLREVGGDVAMTTLANGCICCQGVGELAVTVAGLLGAERPAGVPPIRRIVLETSGLARPGPVLRQLAPLAAHRLRVGVVSTFDPTRGRTLDGFEEAAAQWAGAGRLVLTKLDAVTPGRAEEAAREAAAVNPLAEIVSEPDRAATVRRTFAPVAGTGLPARLPEAGTETDRIATRVVRLDGPVPFDTVAAWLDNLAGRLGERLLRVKGLVRVPEEDGLVLLQSVGTLFSAPSLYRGPPLAPFLVIIARDLRPGEMEAVGPALPVLARAGLGRAVRGGRPLRADAFGQG